MWKLIKSSGQPTSTTWIVVFECGSGNVLIRRVLAEFHWNSLLRENGITALALLEECPVHFWVGRGWGGDGVVLYSWWWCVIVVVVVVVLK